VPLSRTHTAAVIRVRLYPDSYLNLRSLHVILNESDLQWYHARCTRYIIISCSVERAYQNFTVGLKIAQMPAVFSKKNFVIDIILFTAIEIEEKHASHAEAAGTKFNISITFSHKQHGQSCAPQTYLYIYNNVIYDVM